MVPRSKFLQGKGEYCDMFRTNFIVVALALLTIFGGLSAIAQSSTIQTELSLNLSSGARPDISAQFQVLNANGTILNDPRLTTSMVGVTVCA